MKLSTASILAFTALASTSSAFAPRSNNKVSCVSLRMGTPGMDLSGNSWKPDSEKMGVSRTEFRVKLNQLMELRRLDGKGISITTFSRCSCEKREHGIHLLWIISYIACWFLFIFSILFLPFFVILLYFVFSDGSISRRIPEITSLKDTIPKKRSPFQVV